MNSPTGSIMPMDSRPYTGSVTFKARSQSKSLHGHPFSQWSIHGQFWIQNYKHMTAWFLTNLCVVVIKNHTFILTSLIERTLVQAWTKRFLIQIFAYDMLFFKTGLAGATIFAFIRTGTAIIASRIAWTCISTRRIITGALTDTVLVTMAGIYAISLGWDAIILTCWCSVLRGTLWIIIPAARFFLYCWTCNRGYENEKFHIWAKSEQTEQFWPILTSIISHISDKIQQ